jgi:hypothetical protein
MSSQRLLWRRLRRDRFAVASGAFVLRGYDRPLIAAVVLFIGIAVFGINLLVDLLYPFIDRRVGQISRVPRHAAPSSPSG